MKIQFQNILSLVLYNKQLNYPAWLFCLQNIFYNDYITIFSGNSDAMVL